MNILRLALTSAALAAPFTLPTTAYAEGLGAEANYGRADGHWGTEIGAGYAFGLAGFSLTPGAGVYIGNGDTKVYGRVEAAYSIPLSATIGAGVRFSGDHTRPYATLAMPIIPMVRAKANVGPKYYAVGLTLGY